MWRLRSCTLCWPGIKAYKGYQSTRMTYLRPDTQPRKYTPDLDHNLIFLHGILTGGFFLVTLCLCKPDEPTGAWDIWQADACVIGAGCCSPTSVHRVDYQKVNFFFFFFPLFPISVHGQLACCKICQDSCWTATAVALTSGKSSFTVCEVDTGPPGVIVCVLVVHMQEQADRLTHTSFEAA